MAGVGDFNLRSFFRAMGIKNPQPSMREFVQPVIIVGDMSDIVPQYRAPSGIFGGDAQAVAAEFTFIQVTSRAEGGTLIHGFASDATNISMLTVAPALIMATVFEADYPLGMQLSVEPPVSLVQSGTIVVNPGTANRLPNPSSSNQFPLAGMTSRPWWLRPGDTMVFIVGAANTGVNDWNLWITDLPASENSVL